MPLSCVPLLSHHALTLFIRRYQRFGLWHFPLRRWWQLYFAGAFTQESEKKANKRFCFGVWGDVYTTTVRSPRT
jgi:hypothetical protein